MTSRVKPSLLHTSAANSIHQEQAKDAYNIEREKEGDREHSEIRASYKAIPNIHRDNDCPQNQMMLKLAT